MGPAGDGFEAPGNQSSVYPQLRAALGGGTASSGPGASQRAGSTTGGRRTARPPQPARSRRRTRSGRRAGRGDLRHAGRRSSGDSRDGQKRPLGSVYKPGRRETRPTWCRCTHIKRPRGALVSAGAQGVASARGPDRGSLEPASRSTPRPLTGTITRFPAQCRGPAGAQRSREVHPTSKPVSWRLNRSGRRSR